VIGCIAQVNYFSYLFRVQSFITENFNYTSRTISCVFKNIYLFIIKRILLIRFYLYKKEYLNSLIISLLEKVIRVSQNNYI
jgi:uncharacterized MAPEG superfamily protein